MMRIQPARVLWPTDFSRVALQGAHYARGVCETFSAELHVIHVVPPPLSADLAATVPAEIPIAYPEEDLTQTAAAQLERIIAEEFGPQFPTTAAVLLGNPWSAICEYARKCAIDLVVISTNGRTGLPHVLIGSTAERVVQHAPCPVLVVKQNERDFLRT